MRNLPRFDLQNYCDLATPPQNSRDVGLHLHYFSELQIGSYPIPAKTLWITVLEIVRM